MAFKFLNNFSQLLAAALDETALQIEIDDKGYLFSSASTSEQFALTLESEDASQREIVYVTGQTGNTLNVTREQEGTICPAGGWPAGTAIEARLTAGVVGEFAQGEAGEQVPIIGPGTTGDPAWQHIAIGYNAATTSYYTIAIGRNAASSAQDAIALGGYADASGSKAVAIGKNATASAGVAIGSSTYAIASGAIALGSSAYADAVNGICFGSGSAKAPYGIAMGAFASVDTGADHAIAIGFLAKSKIKGGHVRMALSYLTKAPISSSAVPIHAKLNSDQIILATDAIDAAVSGADFTIPMPAGLVVFVDAIDVIVVSAAAPAGSPSLSVGEDAANPATLLPATSISAAALHDRQTFAPIIAGGVTSLYAKLTAPITSGAMSVRVIVRGYCLETL